MARIIYPESFLVQADLFDKINTKHIADGVNSILIQFFLENAIIWANIVADKSNALAQHNLASTKKTLADQAILLRDNLMEKNWNYVLKWVTFLKSLYPTNPKKLEEWSVPVTKSGKTTYPTEVVKRMDILKGILAKHSSYVAPAVSPLKAFNTKDNIDMAAVQADMTTILAAHNDYLKYSGQSTAAIAERNNQFDPVYKVMHQIGDYLVAYLHDNPTRVEDWGYTISLDPAPATVRNSVINKGETVVRTGLLINGEITNTGTVDILIWKGKKQVGTPITLKPGDKLNIAKGFSIITAQNPSTSSNATFSYTTK